MKKILLLIALITISSNLSQSAVVQIDNGEPSSNSYRQEWAFFEESVVLLPDGPCKIDSLSIYLSGNEPVTDTLWICGFPTLANLWPTQYIWESNTLIEPLSYTYDGNEGWKTFDLTDKTLRSEGLDRFLIQHRLKPQGPWFTYDNDGRGSGYDCWITDPFTPRADFYNIIGTIYYYPAGDYMARLYVTYDYPHGNTSEGPPPPFLIDISTQVGLSGRGMSAVVDWNNDGWDDIVNAGSFFESNGNGTYNNINSQLSIERGNTSWADINNDGLLDVFIAKSWGKDKIYLNNGNNNFTDITAQTTIVNNYPTMTPLWLDYNNDGLLDLFIANNRSTEAGNEIYHPDQLWKNNGDGSFTNTRAGSGIDTGEPSPYFDCYGAQAGDYNNDNLMDIFVATYRLARDNIYTNNGDETFNDLGEQTGLRGNPTPSPQYFGHGMGCEWGDFNNDGFLDLCVGNLAHTDSRGQVSNPSLIFKNNGPPNFDFTEMHKDMGLKFYEGNAGVLWLDLDLDGYLDLWHGLYDQWEGNSLGGLNHIYINQGPPDYKLKEITWLSGAVVAKPWTASRIDYDHDGDLDLLIYGKLYRNDMPRKGKWLAFRLVGNPDENVNMDAYGTKVNVYSGDKLFFRELSGSAGGSRCTQNSNELHFGLGNINSIDSVVVIYSNGQKNILTDIELNSRYKIPYMQAAVPNGIATPGLKFPALFAKRVTISPELQWWTSGGSSSYIIQIDTSESFDSENLKEYTNETESLVIENLDTNMIHYWRVKATSENDSSLWSTVWNFSVGLVLPPQVVTTYPPDNAENISALTGFTWEKADYGCEYCADNTYQIRISDDETFESENIINIYDIRAPGYTMMEPLNPGTKYYWQVRANNEEQPGPWSDISSFTTLPLPATPILIEPEDGATEVNNKPRFSWKGAEFASYYQLQVASDEEFIELAFEINNLKSISYKNLAVRLTSGTKYYWRIRAVNDGGIGEWSEKWSFTVEGTQPTVDELINEKTKINIYPNPVNDRLNFDISMPFSDNPILNIYDITGKEIFKLLPTKNPEGKYNFTINNLSLVSGIYYCRLIDGKINKTVKFVVVN
jgi:hypothetical protein